jgi:hypothetical protein
MSVRDRINRYKSSGGAADLVRIEVLVPRDRRKDILDHAAQVRREHRARKQRLQARIDEAYARYGARLNDNIDLTRIPDVAARARIVGNALIERGDARAFLMGRELLAEVE